MSKVLQYNELIILQKGVMLFFYFALCFLCTNVSEIFITFWVSIVEYRFVGQGEESFIPRIMIFQKIPLIIFDDDISEDIPDDIIDDDNDGNDDIGNDDNGNMMMTILIMLTIMMILLMMKNPNNKPNNSNDYKHDVLMMILMIKKL